MFSCKVKAVDKNAQETSKEKKENGQTSCLEVDASHILVINFPEFLGNSSIKANGILCGNCQSQVFGKQTSMCVYCTPYVNP